MLKFNYVLAGFVAIYILQLCFSIWLERVNSHHVKQWGGRIPRPFEGVINAEKLAEMNAYTLEKSRLHQIEQITSDLVTLGLILSGILHLLDFHTVGGKQHFVLAGLFFFATLSLISLVVSLPFNYYHTFVIEEKYGFNRSTIKIWVSDHIKEMLLSIFLLAILLSPVLWLIRAYPNYWWFWGFVVFSSIQLLLTILFPVLIAPLFNKFEPLVDKSLSEMIEKLMSQAGIDLNGIFQMDAGRRSRHTNAYFTGLGKSKRVVLYDTLIQSHSHEETLAVLAHEIGHFKGKHIVKQLALMQAVFLTGFYLTWRMMNWDLLFSTFSFGINQSHVGLFILLVFWQKIGFFLQPLFMSLSRIFEYQADAFAAKLLKTGEHLISAFKRMAADNLANLTPHPLYTRFHYSHPPLVERIARLEKM